MRWVGFAVRGLAEAYSKSRHKEVGCDECESMGSNNPYKQWDKS